MPLNSDYCCGWAMMRAVRDDNKKIVDFVYIYVNTAWCSLTGKNNPAGKKMSEVFPDGKVVWFEMYERVVETGKAEKITARRDGTTSGWDAFSFVTDKDKGECACIFSRAYYLDKCIVSHSKARQEVNRQLCDIIQQHPDDKFMIALRRHFDDYQHPDDYSLLP